MKKIRDAAIIFTPVLFVGALLVLILDYIGKNPSKNDCVIGKDSPDCLESIGGHPLWNY